MNEFLGSQVFCFRCGFFECANSFTESTISIGLDRSDLRLVSTSMSEVLLRLLEVLWSAWGLFSSTSSVGGGASDFN